MEPPPSSSTCQHQAENSTSSSCGASSSTKNRVQRYCPRQKDIRFELECEWEDCTKVLDDMDAYLRHVDEHLNSACDLQCKWRLCDSDELETDDDLKRHVRFHAFHAKLKQIGSKSSISNSISLSSFKIKINISITVSLMFLF